MPGAASFDTAGAAPDPTSCPSQVAAGAVPEQDFYFGGTTVVAPGPRRSTWTSW